MLRIASQRAATRLARHTSLGTDVVRYASIHAFFTRSASTNPLTLPVRTYSNALQLCHGMARARAFSRAFHASRVRSEDKDGKPREEERSAPSSAPANDPPPSIHDQRPHLDSYPRFIQRLAVNLPHLHRPTRDELLGVANGFWERFRIRFRWLTIRSFRKFNADDISAFVSLLVLSQTVWILVGT
jgi:distribution and morphology protein 31